jgi:hypothetical protein
MVYERENTVNIVPADWYQDGVAGETRQLVFYWNGISDNNQKAAPGIYRVAVLIDMDGKKQKFIGNLGIGR